MFSHPSAGHGHHAGWAYSSDRLKTFTKRTMKNGRKAVDRALISRLRSSHSRTKHADMVSNRLQRSQQSQSRSATRQSTEYVVEVLAGGEDTLHLALFGSTLGRQTRTT